MKIASIEVIRLSIPFSTGATQRSNSGPVQDDDTFNAAAREALPVEEGELMVDVNCPWSVSQASDMAGQLQPLQLAWLEEPVWPPDDAHGLAQVRRHGVPIAAGENAAGVQGLRAMFEQGALDVAQPSVAKIGGISAMVQVFELARRYQVRVVPHCFYFGPGLLAVRSRQPVAGVAQMA